MRIQNNIAADNSQRQLGITTRNISSNTEKLSSGFRVNRAADDAAGLAISEKMRTQIRGLNRASLNIQDGISLLQIGDGALQSIHNKMQRMRELAVQSANGTNQELDRQAIQLEFGQLTSEVNQVVQMTNFNNRFLFDGSIGASWEYTLGNKVQPFITSIPAAGDFTPTTVTGWTTPAGFGTSDVAANVGTPLVPVPTSGKFAMQIVTPADGTLNVVIDFGVVNKVNGVDIAPGNMSWDDFLAYFVQEFNSFSGVGKVVDDIRFTAGQIVFDFPRDPSSGNLTYAMGKPPTNEPVADLNRPRVHIGIGGVTPAQTNSLNGTASTGTLGTPGPFKSNYTMLSDGGPALNESDFMANNNTIFGATATAVPMPAARASLPGGSFPNLTINFDGSNIKIPLKPGHYTDAESFKAANQSAFVSHGFDLDVDDEGKLLITTKGMNSSPSFGGLTFNPTTLAASLGFGTLGTVGTEPVPAGFLPIQSGANQADIVKIEIPNLSSRSLGISIRLPEDYGNPTSAGFEHINSLGSGGYAAVANVAGDPMEHSLDVSTQEGASASLSVLTNAINIISIERARMGSQQNRLEFTMANVDNTSENLQAAESRIRDTDMAAEMTTFVKNQILQQSGTAMLAQANTFPNATLQLLG